MDDDLSRFEEWFGQILDGLSPKERIKVTRKLGEELRRSNLKRIAANVQPDGSAMEKRKPRKTRRGKLRKRKGGKMFRRLRLTKNWKVIGARDSVEVTALTGAMDRVARISQFGETASVGRLRDGRVIRAKYAERRLLGFSQEDQDAVLNIVSRWVLKEDA